jgi:hypothetical protein
MTDQASRQEKQLLLIKADYLARYGMEMDDWTAITMLDNKIEFDKMHIQLLANQRENKRLSETFKGSIKQIHFTSKPEAFRYGLGRSLPYAICSLILGILCYVYMSTYKDYENLKETVRSYRNVSSYENLISQGTLTEDEGVVYLVLKPVKKGKHIFGQTYQFDERRKVVKVPLKRLE